MPLLQLLLHILHGGSVLPGGIARVLKDQKHKPQGICFAIRQLLEHIIGLGTLPQHYNVPGRKSVGPGTYRCNSPTHK